MPFVNDISVALLYVNPSGILSLLLSMSKSLLAIRFSHVLLIRVGLGTMLSLIIILVKAVFHFKAA